MGRGREAAGAKPSAPLLPLIILFSLIIPAGAGAQEADTLASAAIYSVKLRPITRPSEEISLAKQADAPSQVADVLRRFTGIQIKDYGGIGGLKTINVRSLGSEHVGIFIDGIQIDNAQNMQVDLGRFSTGSISQVSLYNGQKSVRLQTAKEYSSGAAVHLESARPLLTGSSAGEARLRTGSFATINPSVRWDKDLGPVTLRAAAEWTYSNGKYKYPWFDTTLVRQNGDIRSLRVETMLFGTLLKGDWRLRLYGYGSERGFPGPVIRRASGFPLSAERQADQDLFAQGSWTRDWTARYATALRFKLADNYTHYDTHPELNPMALPYDLHYRQRSAYASVAQSFVISDPWSVDLATDIQRNALDSDVGQFVTPRRTVFNGALATRLAWERLRMGAHLSYLRAWDSFDTPQAGGWSRENGFRDAWMPSAAVSWVAGKGLEVSAFAKRSYRLPSFNDLYYSLMGNSSLVPESASQFGLDLRFSSVMADLTGHPSRWSWDARISPYYNRVDNKIVAIPTSSQFRWTMLNIGKVDITGLDLRACAERQADESALSLTARYSFQQALDHSTPGGLTWGNQIPYIPRHSGSFDAALAWHDWTFTSITTLTGGRWSRTANIDDYYIKPWNTTDLRVSRLIAAGKRGDTGSEKRGSVRVGPGSKPGMRVSVEVNNVFNCRYDIVQGYPMPGTNVMFIIDYKW